MLLSQVDDRDWANLDFSLFLEDGSSTDAVIGMNEKHGFVCDDPTDTPSDSPGYVVIDFMGESFGENAELPSNAALSVLSDALNTMARAAGVVRPDASSTFPVVSVTSPGGQATVCGTGSSDEVNGNNRLTRGGDDACMIEFTPGADASKCLHAYHPVKSTAYPTLEPGLFLDLH